MHTEHFKPIIVHHILADIKIEPHVAITARDLKRLIRLALDSYTKSDVISAETIHKETKGRHGANYQTAGYYLKLYRVRKNLTQKELALLIGVKQHHLSEMEHNKRPIGKKIAKNLAKVLDIDYRKLL